MSFISNNIKYLRKQHQLTQEDFAQLFGVKRAIIGAYEEQRAEPKMELLFKIASHFKLSIDEIVSKNLESGSEKPIINLNKVKGNDMVLSITVNDKEEELIDFVPVKASAGYTTGYADPEYIAELPKFKIPNLSAGTHRAFEIKGDSMLPVKSGSIVLGSYVDDWRSIENNKTYVLITQNDGLVYKRLINEINTNNSVTCISDNKIYQAFQLKTEEILEVWKAKAIISFDIPEPEDVEQLSTIKHLASEIQGKIEDMISKAQK
jgi:DNA-binding XRE family transcriptional regulator